MRRGNLAQVKRLSMVDAPTDNPHGDQIGHGLAKMEFVGKDFGNARLVKRPTLLGSMLSRAGLAPQLPSLPRRGRPPGQKSKAALDAAAVAGVSVPADVLQAMKTVEDFIETLDETVEVPKGLK